MKVRTKYTLAIYSPEIAVSRERVMFCLSSGDKILFAPGAQRFLLYRRGGKNIFTCEGGGEETFHVGGVSGRDDISMMLIKRWMCAKRGSFPQCQNS